jgi:hypothetical protein
LKIKESSAAKDIAYVLFKTGIRQYITLDGGSL